jgi:hypothetical protein
VGPTGIATSDANDAAYALGKFERSLDCHRTVTARACAKPEESTVGLLNEEVKMDVDITLRTVTTDRTTVTVSYTYDCSV